MTKQVIGVGFSPNDGLGDPIRDGMIKVNENFTDLYTNYQSRAGLASNVATLAANTTLFVGLVSAVNVVSNAQLQANLANYLSVSTIEGLQTRAQLNANVSQLAYVNTFTLVANVATLTANNTSFVGSVTAANVVSNAQLIANVATINTNLTTNYQTRAGLSANVATLTANNSNYFNTKTESNLNVNNATTAYGKVESALNVNNSAHLGTVPAASYVNTSGAYTITGVHTHNANLFVNAANVTVNAVANFTNTFFVTGNASFSNAISDSIGNVRTVPQNIQTAAYVLTAADNGKFISITTGGVTVPASIFSNGQNVTIFNNSTSDQTITQASGVTMYQVGTATTGNRTLAQRGLATVVCVAANTFVITGGGLS